MQSREQALKVQYIKLPYDRRKVVQFINGPIDGHGKVIRMRYYNVKEVAKKIGKTQSAVYMIRMQGFFQGETRNKQVFIPESEIRRWEERNSSKNLLANASEAVKKVSKPKKSKVVEQMDALAGLEPKRILVQTKTLPEIDQATITLIQTNGSLIGVGQHGEVWKMTKIQ